MQLTNCINCGAPLKDRKCPYCGTEYTDSGSITADFDGGMFGTLNIDGQVFEVYLSNVEIADVGDRYRLMDGRMAPHIPKLLHKFTLISKNPIVDNRRFDFPL